MVAVDSVAWQRVDWNIVFFFSSRRRHTRFDCDWSSDVCSSDLSRRRANRRAPVRGAATSRPRTVPRQPNPALAATAPSRRTRRSRKAGWDVPTASRSEEHTSELQSQSNLVCRLLLEKKQELPTPRGGFVSFSPDDSKLAYNRVFREFRTWKHYRGGMADDGWIYDFQTSATENLTNNP